MRKFTLKASRMLAMLTALIMMLAAFGAAALAEEPTPEEPLPEPTVTTTVAGQKIYVGKALEMDANANVPNATFNFTIESIDAAIAAAAADDPTTPHDERIRVEPGPAGAVIGSVTFEPGDTTTPKTGDDTKKVAIENIEIDLTGVTFTEPGVYRWKITESATTTAGITNDPTPDRYLDVYVISDEDGNLSISGTYMYKVTTEGTEKTGGSTNSWETDTDIVAYTNTLATKDLVVKKTVSGNQAYRSDVFKFQVTITGASAGTQFSVVHSDGTALGTMTAAADASGAIIATGTYEIKPNESFTVQGLTSDLKYTVEEVIDDGEGYTVKYEIDGAAEGKTDDMTVGKTTGEQDMGEAGHEVHYDNYRNGTVPTGILMDIWPYALIVAIAGVALIVLMVSRKRRNQEN